MKRIKTWLGQLALAGLLVSAGLQAVAQGYPARPVKITIPYAAGGAVDIMGRVLAKELGELNRQAYIVDNKGGAGGAIATAEVAHAPPDGYQILLGATGQLSIIPAAYTSNIGYDPIKDFVPISLIATTPYVLVVNPALPVKSVAELIAYAKAHPGALNFASAGTGGPDHLAGELFRGMTGISAQHVPYKGSGPALNDVMSGQVQYEFVSPLPAMPMVEAGKLRLLAVTSKDRSPALPDVPAVAETVPGFEVTPWYGVFLPAGASKELVAKVYDDIRTVMAREQVQRALSSRGLQPTTNTPEEFAAFVRTEGEKWSNIVKNAGVKIE